MATNQTEHYALNQWELSDSVVMEEFNADNQKLDAALTALDQKIADAVAQVKAAIPRIQIGSYVGTGTWGEDNPCTLTFSFEPKLVIIALEPVATNFDVETSTGLKQQNSTIPLIAIRGAATALLGYDSNRYAVNFQVVPLHLSWQETTLSWYLERNGSSQDFSRLQMNHLDMTYRYIAMG